MAGDAAAFWVSVGAWVLALIAWLIAAVRWRRRRQHVDQATTLDLYRGLGAKKGRTWWRRKT
jgi:uncharacterized membrane protein